MSAYAAGSTVPTTQNCRFCWMCRHVCPVGHVTHRETHTPHAWALLIESVKRGQAEWDDETVEVLYACADCGLCRAHCSTDQPLPDAIAATRATIVASGHAPAAVATLDQQLRLYGNGYGTAAPGPQPATGDIALFVGDAAHHLHPRSVGAVLQLLAAAGIRAIPIGVGRSTGSVAASLGLHRTAVSLGQSLLDEIKATGARELLVMAPGDRWAFEYVYPTRLGLSWPRDVIVKDVVTVLAEALASRRLTVARPSGTRAYAYHDPCHAVRITRDVQAPRALLRAALGAPAQQLFWREDRAHPCGATGGLELTHHDVADRMADARLADVAASGAQVLITEDPLCLDHLRRRGATQVDVVGLYEVLAERLEQWR